MYLLNLNRAADVTRLNFPLPVWQGEFLHMRNYSLMSAHGPERTSFDVRYEFGKGSEADVT